MPPVAVSAPVDGTNDNFVDVTFCGKFPVLAVTQVGYTAVAVLVSSVIAVLVALVAVVADPTASVDCATYVGAEAPAVNTKPFVPRLSIAVVLAAD